MWNENTLTKHEHAQLSDFRGLLDSIGPFNSEKCNNNNNKAFIQITLVTY